MDADLLKFLFWISSATKKLIFFVWEGSKDFCNICHIFSVSNMQKYGGIFKGLTQHFLTLTGTQQPDREQESTIQENWWLSFEMFLVNTHSILLRKIKHVYVAIPWQFKKNYFI